MRITVATDVYVLGFPFGLTGGGAFPIWKRASIASEPDVNIRGLPFFYADTATREGMSGSPVIARTSGQYTTTTGATVVGVANPTRFVGVYSGRIGANDELQAQLGFVWRPETVEEILRSGIPGDFELRP